MRSSSGSATPRLENDTVKKQLTTTIGGLAILLAVTMPAAAAPPDYVTLPGDVKAVALSAEEMDAIHGEGLPSWAVNAAVRAVAKALGSAAGRKLEKLLSGATTPSFGEYRAAFGSKAALVYSLLPELLKPQIAR